MTNALNFASWILRSYPYQDAVSPLKLQKLAFYGYALALAHDVQSEIGSLVFEPWEHGPVNREIWQAFREYGSQPIPIPSWAPIYSKTLSMVLNDTLQVYGLLDAWRLRQQTHLEAPWSVAHAEHRHRIDAEALTQYFKYKYRNGQVGFPEYVLDPGSFSVDGIPVQHYRSLHDLADSVRNALARTQCGQVV